MDALSELGITSISTPLSPMKVWQAIPAGESGPGLTRYEYLPT